MEHQETKIQKVKRFMLECKRILKVTKKPDNVEFKTIVKVSGLGIMLIGAIGFMIEMIKRLIQGL